MVVFCVVLLHKRIFSVNPKRVMNAHVPKSAATNGKNAMTNHAYEARTGIALTYVAKESNVRT